MTGESGDVVLEVRGISKSFAGVRALQDVSLIVRQGRVHALLGENGAGKSTLMNILSGVFRPDAGELLLDGQVVSWDSPRQAREAGVATIFQELNLVPQLTVAQNIFLGREPLTRAGLIDDARMQREAAAYLHKLELAFSPHTLVSELRVGQRQMVEVARALSQKSRIIIMDEPTSAITEQEVAVLHEFIRELKGAGVAIIYITHKLDELPLIADELTVLRDGRFVESKPAQSITRDAIISLMVGRDLSEIFVRSPVELGAKVLEANGIHLTRSGSPRDFVVHDVSFALRRGEVLGVFGLMGAGRTELLETLFGLHPTRAFGKYAVEDREVWFRSPREAIDAGVVLAPEDRKRDGLVLSLSVAANTSLACVEKMERHGLIVPAREEALAAEYAERLRTKTPTMQQLVQNLSGGSQQKVVLAKWLATKPKVLMLDEPTRGIDINAKKEIYGLIDSLVADGLAVLLVSSELTEILGIADRIIVLCEGRKTAELTRAEASEERVMRAAVPRARDAFAATVGAA